MSKEHIMVDIETLGTDPDTPVISIGAVFFGPDGLGEEFSVNLNTTLQIQDGRKPNGDTIKWWMSQSDAAKKVFSEKAVPPEEGLQMFVDFCLKHGKVKTNKPWGRGASFDIPILENILKFYNIKVPWMFWNHRCQRTFTEEIYDGKDLVRQGTHHNALDDSIYQAEVVVEGWKRIK